MLKKILVLLSISVIISLLLVGCGDSDDEQTGKAGMMTRLEAFIDMLWAAQRHKKNQPKKNRFPWIKSR